MDLPPADPDPTDEEAVDHMIGENKQLSEALEQAGIDSLTGFLTKDAFMKKIDGIFGMSGMSGSDDRRPVPNSQVVAVIFADVTGLKQTNDTYGHSEGDKLLVRVSDELRGLVRSSDDLVRLGGDELLIVVYDGDDMSPSELEQYGEAMLAKFTDSELAQPKPTPRGGYPEGVQPPDTVAFGVGTGQLRPLTDEERAAFAKDPPGTNIGDFIKQADDRMYAHKQWQKKQKLLMEQQLNAPL